MKTPSLCQLRFNHQHNGSGLVWRLFVDGVEHLISDFHISVPSWGSESTDAAGVAKWNIEFRGVVTLLGTVASID
jgi:hypothetical protein